MIKDIDLGYVAGIVDGEGWIRLGGKDNKFIRMAVSMTDLDVLERCQFITDLGKITGPYIKRKGNKNIWYWSINSNDAAALLMTIYPLLSMRRQQKIVEVLSVWKKTPLDQRYTINRTKLSGGK